MDTAQHVFARENVTRETKTLHGIKGEMARTVQEPCDSNSNVGSREKCHSSAAHVIDGVSLIRFCQMLCAILMETENMLASSAAARQDPIWWSSRSSIRAAFENKNLLILWVVVSSCLYLLRKEQKFVVVVPATPLGTQDPRQTSTWISF